MRARRAFAPFSFPHSFRIFALIPPRTAVCSWRPLSWTQSGALLSLVPLAALASDSPFTSRQQQEQPQPGMKSKRWVVDVGPTPRSRSALALEENPYDAL